MDRLLKAQISITSSFTLIFMLIITLQFRHKAQWCRNELIKNVFCVHTEGALLFPEHMEWWLLRILNLYCTASVIFICDFNNFIFLPSDGGFQLLIVQRFLGATSRAKGTAKAFLEIIAIRKCQAHFVCKPRSHLQRNTMSLLRIKMSTEILRHLVDESDLAKKT